MSGFVPKENLYGKSLWTMAILNESCQRHLKAVVVGVCMASLLPVFCVSEAFISGVGETHSLKSLVHWDSLFLGKKVGAVINGYDRQIHDIYQVITIYPLKRKGKSHFHPFQGL